MSYECHIVLDLEFNPTSRANRRLLRNEILEIGAVKLNAQMEEIGRFSCLVKPELNSIVDPQIVKLTGIRTEDVRNAHGFADALRLFAEWVGPARARICSWSDNDLTQLQKECSAKGVEFPVCLGRWMDIQKIYQRIIHYPARQHLALRYAAKMLDVPFSDTEAHRAVYDTEVTADIYRMMCSSGFLARQREANRTFVTGSTHSTYSIGSACGSALAALMATLPAA